VEVNGRQQSRQTAEYLTDFAVEFIRAHKDKPFVIQVSHHAVHIPLTTTTELATKYKAKEPMPGYPSRPEYAGLLEELDQSVGRIVTAVDAAGLSKNTLIVFVSDNGGLEHEQSGRIVTSNKPLRGEKGTLYEGGIRIPAIARWQDTIPAESLCETPAITMDLYPTLLEVASVNAAADQPPDGFSLTRLIHNPRASLEREMLFWHLPHYHHSSPSSAIRNGDWKMIEFYETGSCELYDLHHDLGEQHDLAATQPDRVESMRVALSDWRKQVAARMPKPNPDYDPQRATELSKANNGKRKGANE
jgi:arylsulfatase A